MWLARGHKPRPEPVPEIPGDISPRKLTRPIILFAVIRAIAVSIAVAIAFWLHLRNAYWMPIATLVAMKSSAQQSTLGSRTLPCGGADRRGGGLCVSPDRRRQHALEAIVVVLGALGASNRVVNYAFCAAAVNGCVLIAIDLRHPYHLGGNACSTRSLAWGSL
jgi:hypothetical protein